MAYRGVQETVCLDVQKLVWRRKPEKAWKLRIGQFPMKVYLYERKLVWRRKPEKAWQLRIRARERGQHEG